MELPVIVGEIGLNGNGDLDLNKAIIKMVVDAADSASYPRDKVLVKFQKRDPEISTPESQKSKMRVSPVSGNYMTYLEYRYEIEFGLDEYTELDHYCKQLGIGMFASVWDTPSAEFVLVNFPHWPYIKIPSAHITNLPLIRQAALHDGGLIISTGMSDMDMVQDAFSAAYMRASSLTLLACNSTYPTPDNETNLLAISTLRNLYGSYAGVGFSSHSVSVFPAIYSILVGATMLELHATIDRSLPGSDQSASIERKGWNLLFREAVRISELMGDGEIKIQPSEIEKLKALRGD